MTRGFRRWLALPWYGVLLLCLVAAAVGAGSAWLTVRALASAGAGGVAVGPWRTSTLAGSADADLYTRAAVALGALLALQRSETLYYLASADSQGRALKANCRYRVSGPVPPARWWSVTAYDGDHFLFDAPGRRYSVNGGTPGAVAGERFAMEVGPQAAASGASAAALPLVPTVGQGDLLLALRVYNPVPALVADAALLVPPVIEPVGGCG